MAFASLSAAMTQAAEVPPVLFDENLRVWGKTLVLEDKAKLGVFPNALPAAGEVIWTVSGDTVPKLPVNQRLQGSLYRYTITGSSALNPDVARPLAVSLPAAASEWKRAVWLYDRSSKKWTKLRTGGGGTRLTASPKSLDAYLAVLEDRTHQQGIASWYCKLRCSSRYPVLHGTSNDFPVGSSVVVKSLENGRSVKVKIVSRWGKPAGRVVDLSWAAFKIIKGTNGGLARVTVHPATSVAGATATTVHSTVSPETIPQLLVTRTGTAADLATKSPSYYVMDQATGMRLTALREMDIRPIASLTKLMTAAVFLDTQPDLQAEFTYAKTDGTGTPYDYLNIEPGEKVLVADLFYSMMVGSANNAATALTRAAGLSRADFVARMNAKAGDWGLTHTRFTEVSGLDAGNVSTAKDMAVMAARVFHEYHLVRYASGLRQYEFTTQNTKQYHRIANTDKNIINRAFLSRQPHTGSKTGFIDESMFTYAVRTKHPSGAQIVSVVLGAPTSTDRFTEGMALTNWAVQQYQWQ